MGMRLGYLTFGTGVCLLLRAVIFMLNLMSGPVRSRPENGFLARSK